MDDQEKAEWDKIGQFLNGSELSMEEEIFRSFAHAALDEFSNVADYIWKTPKFIDREIILEKEKLESYFPLTGDERKDELATRLRIQRWEHESHKLFELFPNLLAVANLFSCLALFEAHCLRLALLIEARSKFEIAKVSGRGIQRIFGFFSDAGLKHFDLDYSLQINSALKIRNCLIHAEGILSWDKDESSIRRIVAKGTFLSQVHRDRLNKLGRPIDEVIIADSDIGERIRISNEYSHVVSTYARSYLISAATVAHRIYINPHVP